MPVDYSQIGQRLRAHRLGLGLSPEKAAERLGVSRAALYNYERGSAPIKVETLERMAEILDVSLPSLLGVGTEYYPTAIGYFERLRQLEAESQRITLFYEPLTFLLTSSEFPSIFRTMLVEGLPQGLVGAEESLAEIDLLLTLLLERRAVLTPGGPALAGIIGLVEVRRLLRTGLIGTYALTEDERQRRRAAARREVERTADLMQQEPLGVQIAVVDDTLPNQSFEVLRLRDGSSMVAVSPFRLGEFPNVRSGVASITAAQDAVTLYERLVADIWSRGLKGARGADALRRAIVEHA